MSEIKHSCFGGKFNAILKTNLLCLLCAKNSIFLNVIVPKLTYTTFFRKFSGRDSSNEHIVFRVFRLINDLKWHMLQIICLNSLPNFYIAVPVMWGLQPLELVWDGFEWGPVLGTQSLLL